MIRNEAEPTGDSKETTRLEAFSDGVFAIAITLLILEIKVPHELGEGKSLFDALLKTWPSFLAFTASFLTILVMWINHHRLFTHIRRSNTLLMFFNGLLLLSVTFVPYPTSIVAEYVQDKEQNTAVMFYCATFVLISIFFNLLWRYASYKNKLLDRNANPIAVRAITQAYNVGPLLYLVAFALAAVSALASLILTVVLAVFFALPDKSEREVDQS